MLLVWRRDRPVRMLVTVSDAHYGPSEKDPGGRAIDGALSPSSYQVTQGLGGTLTVTPEELTPAGVLDRIVMALEDSEFEGPPSSELSDPG